MGLLELVTTMLLFFCLFRNTGLYIWFTRLQSCYVNMLMVWQGWKKEERVLVLAGEWWITFALALLSRLQHLSLHFLIKTSVSRGLRHLKSDSRMVSRSCQVDQQVKLLGKSRWKPWCQCPAGTRTRPDTRYFICYPTRPDSVLKIIG